MEGLLSTLTVPSGNDCYIAIENDTVEIADFPIQNDDFPQLCNKLPEGKSCYRHSATVSMKDDNASIAISSAKRMRMEVGKEDVIS